MGGYFQIEVKYLGRYKAGTLHSMCDAAGARHAPERLCGGPCFQRGAITSVRVRPLPLHFGYRRRPRYHINLQLDLELNAAHRCHLNTLKHKVSHSRMKVSVEKY